MILDEQTIFALSTAPGVGGIAVIRVSGPESLRSTRKLCPFLPARPKGHQVYYGWLKDDKNQEIDEVLVTYFEKEKSFTGEETLEISCHGGIQVTQSILQLLGKTGIRIAEPGEFSFRSFMNGKIDLVQAEAILSLIESQSKQGLTNSIRQLRGDLSHTYLNLESEVTWLLAHLEANIDFASEDIVIASDETLIKKSKVLKGQVEKLLDSYKTTKLLNDGLRVGIVGEPNVGKSSLLNCLLKDERAIVTDEAGTTRDLIEAKKNYNGIQVEFIDSAGLRKSENKVEKIGIQKTLSIKEQVDLSIVLVDINNLKAISDNETLLDFILNLDPEKILIVGNKTDLCEEKLSSGDFRSRFVSLNPILLNKVDKIPAEQFFTLSVLKNKKVDELENFLINICSKLSSEMSAVSIQARHKVNLEVIGRNLDKTIELLCNQESPEFISFELQSALHKLNEILGKEFHDEVLDKVFNEFCLGK